MLISIEKVKEYLDLYNIHIEGVLHIGAYECEEIGLYNQLGITNEQIIWIDALESKVLEAKARNIPNVFQAVITDKDDDIVNFNLSNNGQSSSIFEFGTHAQEHPWVVYVNSFTLPTVTIDSFFERNNLNPSRYNFWNFDIQGAELLALKGASNAIQFPQVIYLEVNEKELYKNCGMINELDVLLSTYNFKRVYTIMTQHGWGDALYIRV